MTTTATIEKKEKSITEIFAVRDTALLEINFTLDEFASHVKLGFEDWGVRKSWRVEGDEDLYLWMHHLHQKRDEEKLSDSRVIEIAYNFFKQFQARKGQVNCGGIYLQGCEDVYVIPRKGLEHATVRVVQDRVDGLYRYSTDYWCGLGGCSSAPSFYYSKITKTKTDAILQGAREMLEYITNGWESKDDPGTYNPFLNKIKKFIENLEDTLIQPSLFS